MHNYQGGEIRTNNHFQANWNQRLTSGERQYERIKGK